MIYEYACDQCEKQFEVVKPMEHSGTIEVCEECGAEARRLWSSKVQLHNTKVKDAEYYPSLGQVVKNDRHRKELIKKHGLIEIGNEKPERARYHIEKHRKERLKKSWDEE